MARKPRIHYSGAFYHVMLRGNGGQDLFYDEKDGQEFRELIADGIDRMGYNIHAYCFMPDHVHLLIEVADVALSKIMQNLSFRYSRYINIKMDRTGHVFAGRFKALLIDSDSYLLDAVRYIHLNPVVAGLATSASDWLWSSHRSYLNKTEGSIVHTDRLLTMLSQNNVGRERAYENFMGKSAKTVWPPKNMQGDIVGDANFVAKVSDFSTVVPKKYVRLPAKELFNVAKAELGATRAELRGYARGRDISRKRAVFAKAVLEACGYSIAEIAKGLNRDGSSLGRIVHKIDDKDPDVIALKAAIRAA